LLNFSLAHNDFHSPMVGQTASEITTVLFLTNQAGLEPLTF
jgi:hypothetical protein